ARPGRRTRHEGPLPNVRPRPPRGDQLVVREGHRGPIHAEVARQLARGRQLHAGGEEPLADQPLDVDLDLANERRAPGAIASPIERNPHARHFGLNMRTVNYQLDDLDIIHCLGGRRWYHRPLLRGPAAELRAGTTPRSIASAEGVAMTAPAVIRGAEPNRRSAVRSTRRADCRLPCPAWWCSSRCGTRRAVCSRRSPPSCRI